MFAAIDGGGTHTRAALFDATGRKIVQAETGAANHHFENLSDVESRLNEAFTAACRQARVDPREIWAVGAGLAGIDPGIDTPDWFRRLFPLNRCRAVWDGLTAYRAALNSDEGAVIIAGTGSVVYARNKKGEFARVGGWGPLACTDWGADQIARWAISIAVEAEDGRRSPSPLTTRLRSRLGLPDIAAFARTTRSFTRAELAACAAEVGKTAEVDPASRIILKKAAWEMSRAIRTALERVGLNRREALVSYSGSVFGGEYILKTLEAFLVKLCPQVVLVPPQHEPIYGAYLLARETYESGIRGN